jgi:hypothetical protein
MNTLKQVRNAPVRQLLSINLIQPHYKDDRREKAAKYLHKFATESSRASSSNSSSADSSSSFSDHALFGRTLDRGNTKVSGSDPRMARNIHALTYIRAEVVLR